MAIGLSLTSTAAATAQEEAEPIDLTPVPADQVVGPFQVDDGSYSGSLAYVINMTMSRSSLTLQMVRQGGGPASFTVTDGTMDGNWSSTETSFLNFPSNPGMAEAEGTGTATGTLTGSFPYSLTGSYFTEATATATVPAIGISASDTGSDTVELTFEIAQTVQICDQVLANWDESMSEQMIGFGWTPSVRTQLAVFGAADGDQFGERINGLLGDAAIAMDSATDPGLALLLMGQALLDAERLMSDMESFPETCSPQPEFLRVINQMLADFVNSLLERWSNDSDGVSMIVLRKLVEVSLRAGLIGAGAADPATAQYLEGRITGLLQARFDSFQDPTAADYDLDELRRTLVVANMLGYELTPNVSTEDLCLALGGC